MSNPYVNSNTRAESLNASAAHDSALYDPDLHDNQIVAVYDSMPQACAARDALLGAGIERGRIHVVDRTGGDASGPSSAEDRNQHGLWGAVKSLFAPAEDVAAYRHAVGRGHAMLVLLPTATMDRHRAIQILESSGPIDFDAKLEEWRQAAYDQMPDAGAAQMPRTGQREAVGSSRVRSYVVQREWPTQQREEAGAGPGVATPIGTTGAPSAGDNSMGTGGPVTNATAGATSSGMNAPRTRG